MTTALKTAHKPDSSFDPIAMEVFSNRLLSITEDMAFNIMRSSFSTQIKERRDFSVGLFNRRGQLIAQGTHVPMHLGSLLGSMEALLERYDVSRLREGDAFVCNDAYVAGGTHLPDISIVTPIFLKGELCGFAANIGHHSDIGGIVPGSIAASANSIFQEGLRIPIVPLVRAGEVDEDVLNFIALNSRLAEERALDLRVQIATNERGAAAVRQLFERMGLEAAERAIDDVLLYTERRLRARIASIPDGTSSYRTYLDDDGVGDEPQTIQVTVTIKGDDILVDLAGSAPQARGALNMTRSAIHATVYYAIKALLDPDLFPNSGMFDAIRISAPKGSIANPQHPAPVGARTVACQKVAGALFGAFRTILQREAVMASGNDAQTSIHFAGQRDDGSYYVAGETLGGGSGARFDGDGMSGIHVHITNTLNLPVESWENEFPLLIESYGLAPDSGGAGRQRGGLSLTRKVRALKDGTTFSSFSDGHKRGADGIDGGKEGGHGQLIRNEGEQSAQRLRSKVSGIVLNAGETIRIQTPGAGGFGDPAMRSLEAIADDIEDGLVTEAAASADYGRDRVEAALKLIGSAQRPR